jgi:hypothetical protein
MYISMYIQGSVHIAAMYAVKHSAIEVAFGDIVMYILGSVLIAAMSAVKHSEINVT